VFTATQRHLQQIRINICDLERDENREKSDLESIQLDDDKKYEEDDVEFLGYSCDPTNVKQEEVEFVGYVTNEGKYTLPYAF